MRTKKRTPRELAADVRRLTEWQQAARDTIDQRDHDLHGARNALQHEIAARYQSQAQCAAWEKRNQELEAKVAELTTRLVERETARQDEEARRIWAAENSQPEHQMLAAADRRIQVLERELVTAQSRRDCWRQQWEDAKSTIVLLRERIVRMEHRLLQSMTGPVR